MKRKTRLHRYSGLVEVRCKQCFFDEKPVVPGNRGTKHQLNVWSTVFSLLVGFVYKTAMEFTLMPFLRVLKILNEHIKGKAKNGCISLLKHIFFPFFFFSVGRRQIAF